VGVVNARFLKPLDDETIFTIIRQSPFVVTVEEGCLMGGFGSAVLEAANNAGLETSHVRRLGVPDRYIQHADRGDQLAEAGLDRAAIVHLCRQLAASVGVASAAERVKVR